MRNNEENFIGIIVLVIICIICFSFADTFFGEKDNAIVTIVGKVYVPESYDTDVSTDEDGNTTIDTDYNPPQYNIYVSFNGRRYKVNNRYYFQTANVGEKLSVIVSKHKWTNGYTVTGINNKYVETGKIE